MSTYVFVGPCSFSCAVNPSFKSIFTVASRSGRCRFGKNNRFLQVAGGVVLGRGSDDLRKQTLKLIQSTLCIVRETDVSTKIGAQQLHSR